MIKLNKKVIISIALIFILTLIFTTDVLALNNIDFFNPSDTKTPIANTSFLQRIGKVIGWIKYIGILISVVTLTIIGIKYLFSSVEGKAEYKKTMIPYVLGCFLLVGISVVLGIIESIAGV